MGVDMQAYECALCGTVEADAVGDLPDGWCECATSDHFCCEECQAAAFYTEEDPDSDTEEVKCRFCNGEFMERDDVIEIIEDIFGTSIGHMVKHISKRAMNERKTIKWPDSVQECLKILKKDALSDDKPDSSAPSTSEKEKNAPPAVEAPPQKRSKPDL